MADGFFDDFKRFFLRGLAAVLPALLTLTIIVYVLKFMDQNIVRYIDQAVRWVVVQVVSIQQGAELSFAGPDAIWRLVEDKVWQPLHLRWVSFLLAFVLIYIFGRFVASLIGRALWRFIETSFFRMPVVKQIYPSVKQVTDFLLAERKLEFSRVVAVEYPRKGIWSLGLVTGESMKTLHDALGDPLVTIFIPSSPTPVTGYTITVRKTETIDLPVSIDEALRFTISGGVIMPPREVLDAAAADRNRRGMLPPETRRKRKSKETAE